MPLYSHSRLNAFEQCPLQYKFRYLDRIPAEVENIEAFTGKMVHRALEEHFRSPAAGGADRLAVALDRFRSLWKDNWSGRVRVVKKQFTPEHYHRAGLACIENFFRGESPREGERTLGVEDRILVNLDPEGRYRMQGYIDRLVLTADGAYEIHDFKTGMTLPSQSRLDQDRQLAIYQLGVEERFGTGVRVLLVWHYLYFGRTFVSVRTAAQLQDLRNGLIRKIGEVEAATEFPARESALCRWCEYERICPARKSSSTRKRSASPRDRVLEGIRLVDGYVARLQNGGPGAGEADGDLDRIRAAILDYSRQTGLEAVVGNSHVARIRNRPGKSPGGARDIQLIPLQGGQLKFFE